MTTKGRRAAVPRRTVPISRRQFLTIQALASGSGLFLATEAVASTAIEHPEWDMDERRTFDEWERVLGRVG